MSTYYSRAQTQTAPIRDQDIRDLIKTIQIQLCLKQADLTPQVLKKLIATHQTLPVLNVQFLQMLLEQNNKAQELRLNSKRKEYDFQVFNLNISQINLPSIENP